MWKIMRYSNRTLKKDRKPAPFKIGYVQVEHKSRAGVSHIQFKKILQTNA